MNHTHCYPLQTAPDTQMRDELTLFPNMPHEVFDTWLAPIIEHSGWPFVSVADPFPSVMWSDLFFQIPLAFWAQFRWRRHDGSLGTTLFHPASMQLVGAIAGFDTGDPFQRAHTKACVRSITNTAQRLSRATEYATMHQRTPGVLIGIQIGRSIRLVDGHHRVAGAFRAPNPNITTFTCWLADASGLL